MVILPARIEISKDMVRLGTDDTDIYITVEGEDTCIPLTLVGAEMFYRAIKRVVEEPIRYIGMRE